MTAAMNREDALAVTYIACQYGRFLAYKCGDIQHAHQLVTPMLMAQCLLQQPAHCKQPLRVLLEAVEPLVELPSSRLNV